MSTTRPAAIATDYVVTAIHDTRDAVAIGDKVTRVAGTGELRPCDHCGAGHEVHVTVTNFADTLVVGTSCARHLRKSARPSTTFTSPAPVMLARTGRRIFWVNPVTDEEFSTEVVRKSA